ncbi:hypothetical protein KOI40_03230 [Aestuariicella sp. G3-2]|uniref:DUF6559 family protein n=1 Tax=Pseudomaricurvus albidus TaxID=2842452 RepID=UPI001C0AC296|nr:DUF6559 family protein [Aestuariicella albida]MBU3068815.1 hypothetical protein [Aestuariicella albida]
MNFISRYLKNRAIKSYVLKLAPLLSKRYGVSDQYTVGQISRTIQQYKLNSRFIAYAIALYRFEASFNTITRHQIDQPFLDQLRAELANLLALNPKFTARDILALAAPAGWKGDMHTNWEANRHGKTGF